MDCGKGWSNLVHVDTNNADTEETSANVNKYDTFTRLVKRKES